MKDFNLGQALMNPMAIAGLQGLGYTGADNLAQAAQLQLQQDAQARDKYELQRQQFIASALPQVLQNLDWSNPEMAAGQLAGAGLNPQEIMQLFGMHTGQADISLGQDQLGLQRSQLDLQRERLGLDREAATQQYNFKLQELMSKLEGEIDPQEELKRAQQLRGELSNSPVTKQYNVVKTAYQKVKEASKNPSPANDIALIFATMKLYDPGSVVRESEYATAENAAGVPDRVRQQYNKALEGHKLTAKQRKDFEQSARAVFKAETKSYKSAIEPYRELAKRQKVKPEDVIIFEPEEIEEEIIVPGIADTDLQQRALAAKRRRMQGGV